MEAKPDNNTEKEKFFTQTIVIKVGSNALTQGATQEQPLDLDLIDDIARQCSILFKSGVKVVLVSSGAVASGKQLLGKKEEDMVDRQVEALFGQPGLMREWVGNFKKYGVKCGQVLVTEIDLPKAVPVIKRAIEEGIVIVNENDTVSDEEMRQFLVSADNDRLAGFVTARMGADTLLTLTNVRGVLDGEGKLVEDGKSAKVEMLDGKSEAGTGGMKSKVYVSMLASQSGKDAYIASASYPDIILKVARREAKGICTVFSRIKENEV